MEILKIFWICCLLVFTEERIIEATNSKTSSLITPKNLHKVVANILPLFLPSNKDGGDSRKIEMPKLGKAIEGFQDTLDTSAKYDEDWTTFGKRLAALAMTGSKEVSKNKNIFNSELATKLFKNSPQFIKDSLKAHADGSVVPVLEEKIAEIIKTMKENMTSRTVDAEGKQIIFDPVVFGVNSMLNLLYVAAFNAAVLPTMGLDNLFYPDYDYVYEDEEAEEEAEEAEEDYYYDEEGDEGHKGHKGQKGHKEHEVHEGHKGHKEHEGHKEYEYDEEHEEQEHQVLDHIQGHKIHLPVKEEHVQEQHVQIQPPEQHAVHEEHPQIHPQVHPQLHEVHPQVHQQHAQVHTMHPQVQPAHPHVQPAHPQVQPAYPQVHIAHSQLQNGHPQVHTDHPETHNKQNIHQENPSQYESSYMFYPGQRLQLPTINHIVSNPTITKDRFRDQSPTFNRLKMFRPNKQG